MADRIALINAEINGTVDIMKNNVVKVLRRDEKLSDIEEKSEILREQSSNFHQKSIAIKRKMWWQNAKTWLIIGVVVVVIIGLLVLVFSI